MNWEALRAEYVAGGIGQAALARVHGVKPGTLKRRARDEGWVALRRAAVEEKAGAADGKLSAADERASQVDEGSPEEQADGQIALRLRKALLMKLERAAATMPCDATEIKTTDEGGAVKLLKLRDLTAAYKELVGDLEVGDAEQSRVVIDV